MPACYLLIHPYHRVSRLQCTFQSQTHYHLNQLRLLEHNRNPCSQSESPIAHYRLTNTLRGRRPIDYPCMEELRQLFLLYCTVWGLKNTVHTQTHFHLNRLRFRVHYRRPYLQSESPIAHYPLMNTLRRRRRFHLSMQVLHLFLLLCCTVLRLHRKFQSQTHCHSNQLRLLVQHRHSLSYQQSEPPIPHYLLTNTLRGRHRFHL